jgi:hypothetical protein
MRSRNPKSQSPRNTPGRESEHRDTSSGSSTSASADAPLKIPIDPSGDVTAQTTQQLARPSVRAAVTAQRYSRRILGDLDLSALRDELSKQCVAVNEGDMKRPEAMLVSQAHALEAIFHELARVAALNIFTNLAAGETCLRLALKAQGQCRATLETLSNIKNPPASVAFVKQANIANGPQQVNNTTCSGVSPRAEEKSNPPNELLEQQRGTRLDTLTPSAAKAGHPSLASLAEIDGAKVTRRQGEG